MRQHKNLSAGFWARLSIFVWATYGVIAGYGYPLTADALCLAMSTVIVTAEHRRHAAKIMDCTSLGYFALELALIATMGVEFVQGLHLVLAWGVFAIVAWLTLAVGFPFATQYERERAPRERWDDPLFYAMNQRITEVWASIFTAGAIMGGISMVWGYRLIFGLILPALAMVLGAVFSHQYGKRITARFADCRPSFGARQRVNG